MSHILGSVEDLASKDLDDIEVACTKEAFTDADEVFRLINKVSDLDSVRAEIALTNFTKLLSQYQLQPHLLDSHLDKMLQRLIGIVKDGQSSIGVKHEAFKYLVVVSHVRGYKTVARMLPHEVADLEPVLKMLIEQDAGDVDTWATRHMLLLWLSIIVMMPFHMSRLDSFTAEDADGRQTAMERILEVCKKYLLVLDSCHRPAAFLTSRFFTRSDVTNPHMKNFFEWAKNLEGNPPAGVLAAVCWIFKHGKRDDLLPFATPMLRWAQECTKGDQVFCLTHKFAMKLIQRIGLTYLKPRLAPWRYQRGSRSLAENLTAPSPVAEQASSTSQEEEDEEFDVPEELEEVVNELIEGLRHSDLVVRWSAAKGLGRLTVRLPKELGDDVVGSVLGVMNAREVPHAWHGGCLALAELCRRGLLLPSRLPEVVPIVLKALAFDEKRANLPVGAVIRDSACYVCWSFARAFDKEVLQPYINSIASALVVVTVFDREINCRRAASAAFQENVGRQGTFPHGLEILTTADFFAVGIRNNAFLEISVFVAQFEEYTLPLIDHLLHKKVDHWDISIRELAAKSLRKLARLAPGHMTKVVLPELMRLTSTMDLHSRHGAVTAIGEVLAGLSECEDGKNFASMLDETILTDIKDLVTNVVKRQQFQGMGGDLMRQAVLSFIKNASIAKMPFHEHTSVLGDWQKVIIDSMKQVDPSTRSRSVEALPSFCEQFCRDPEGVILERQSSLISILLESLTSLQAETTRMGFCRALGALPKFMFEGVSSDVILALAKCSEIRAETAKWAESRRDALLAMSAVCATVGSCPTAQGDEKWWYPNQASIVFHRFIEGLNDYTRDSRGDVGAWVREASMAGLQSTIQLVLTAEPCGLTEELMTTVIGLVARNAIERIDRTRKQAGNVFSNLIHSTPQNTKIPCLDALLQIFTVELCKEINWSAEVQTFPLFTQMLSLPPYTSHVLMGLIASVGGVTESLVKHSSSSLFDYLRQQTQEELTRISKCILQIFSDYQGHERIIMPLLRFLDRLFNSGVLSNQDGTLPDEFAINLVKLVSKETARCSAPLKLLEAIPVLCHIAGIRAEKKASDAALSYLVIFLCHRFPRVRAVTAEQMYETIQLAQEEDGFPDSDLEAVLNLLSETNWTDDSVDVIRPIRNEICDMLQIPKPKAVQKKPAA